MVDWISVEALEFIVWPSLQTMENGMFSRPSFSEHRDSHTHSPLSKGILVELFGKQ